MNEAIKKRRSVRSFDPDKSISKEKLDVLLEAAMLAPSSCNSRSWEFIAVTKREVLDNLAATHPFAAVCKTAAAAIIVVALPEDELIRGFFPQDCAAATQNILLQAVELGLGTCWCGVYPQENKMGALRAFFGIPQSKVPFNVIAVGVPAETPEQLGFYDAKKVTYLN